MAGKAQKQQQQQTFQQAVGRDHEPMVSTKSKKVKKTSRGK